MVMEISITTFCLVLASTHKHTGDGQEILVRANSSLNEGVDLISWQLLYTIPLSLIVLTGAPLF